MVFLATTQDERQFQVVSDRERWFNIVMGSQYQDDAGTTEREAQHLRLFGAPKDYSRAQHQPAPWYAE